MSVYLILSSLREAGWVAREPVSQKYKLSENLLMFGFRLISNIELQKVAGHYLNELARITGETSALSIRVGLEGIFLQEVSGRYAPVTTIHIGASMPLWIGSDGKAMLAFLPPDDIEKAFKQLENPKAALTPLGNRIDVQALKQELVKIKKQGYAISAGEYRPDGCAVASPVFGHNQKVIGSLRLRGTLPRFNRKLAQKYAPFVVKTANMMSQELVGTTAFSNTATKYVRSGKR